MSWSYRITFLYLGFVGLIISLVVISSNNKEELVAKDYYAQELSYQARIDAINNERSLDESISHSVNADNITLLLPSSISSQNLSGEIYFYCPSGSKNDLKVTMQFDHTGKQTVNKKSLNPGVYKMRLSWVKENKKYFREEVITIK